MLAANGGRPGPRRDASHECARHAAIVFINPRFEVSTGMEHCLTFMGQAGELAVAGLRYGGAHAREQRSPDGRERRGDKLERLARTTGRDGMSGTVRMKEIWPS